MSEDRDDHWGEQASRDDGWRSQQAVSSAPRPRPLSPHVFWHAWECSLLAIVILILAANWLPRFASWQLAVAGLAAVTITAAFTALNITRSGVVAGYLGLCGAAAAGWIAWTYFAGLWHSAVIGLLVIAASVLGLLAPAVAGHHREQLSKDEAARSDRNNELELKRWSRLFATEGIPGVAVTDVRGNAGPIRDLRAYPGDIEVTGRLGAGTSDRRASTYEQLTGIAAALAVTLRRDADGVYFSQPEAGSTADFTMHIRPLRAGRKRPVVHLPQENRPLTVTKPLAFGVFDNNRVFRESLRERHVLIGGSTGSGKSTLLNVMLAQLAACPDCLIWFIDMKGGITARPWIEPYLRELTPRPVIDWVATTRDEAKIMLETGLELCRIRSSYKVFEKITPTEDIPAFALFCDDMGACFGHGKVTGSGADRISNFGLAQLGAEFTEMARSAAGMMIGAVQRTNVELMGGTGIKAMSSLRFGLRCEDSADGQRIFPDDPHAARLLASLRDNGDALVKRPGGITPVVHLYRMDSEDRITNRALWAGAYTTPVLEPDAARRLGEAYARRWERPGQLDLLGAWRESAGIAEPGQDRETDEDWSRTAWLELDPEDSRKLDPRRIRMREIVREAGPAGIPVRRILARLAAEGMDGDRSVVQRWLQADEKAGLVQRGLRDDHWRWSDQDRMPGGL